MKKRFTIIMLLISGLLIGQNGINYKALIKDVNGNAIVNQSIDIVFSIQFEGNTLYSELQQIITDNNGIAIATIGEGSAIAGTFDAIDWKLRNLELNVQIDSGDGLIDFGNSPFNAVPYAINTLRPQGLESIDEGNGIGWRLAGSNPDNYGNIGFRSTDLSYSNLESISYGATGPNSIAMGVRTSANGDSSISLGSDNIALEDFSTAIGAGSTASGGSSTAIGSGSQATANSSTAIGYTTSASGFASTALGFSTAASGSYSSAMGRGTNAVSISSTAIGQYNFGYGNPTVWNDSDPLFQIGNGSSNSNRNNAFTVFKSGAQLLSSDSYGMRLYPGDTTDDFGIEIIDPGSDGIIIDSPGGNGISINDANNNGLSVTSGNYGARIIGTNVGLYASASFSQNDNPDIILGSAFSSSQGGDDGIISTNPARLGSDMFLRSYDAVVVQLDYDGNENGNFRIRNSDQDVVFDVNESGTVSTGDILRIGDINIERTVLNSLDFLRVNSSIMPNEDAEHILGAGAFRWINVWAVDGTINTSDRREKKNIEDLNYGLNEVLQMQPVSFNWKNKNNQDLKLGLIAQDLQVLIPEVVKSHTWEKDQLTGALTKKEVDRLGVYYSDLVPVLIKAIQEQNKIIESQGNALSTSKKNYEALLSRIEILETKSSN